MTSPAAKWRKKIHALFEKPFKSLSGSQRFWIGFVFLCLLTTILIDNPIGRMSSEAFYNVGDIARESVVSPADIHSVDEEETERLRQTMRDSVIPIFTAESKRSDEAVQNFRSAWEDLQRKMEKGGAANSANKQGNLEWAGAGGAELGAIFAARRFSNNEFEALTRILRENSSGDIYSDQDAQFLQGGISIVDRQRPTDRREVRDPTLTMI